MRHPIPRSDMVRALEEKGFVCGETDRNHDYYYFIRNGKQTRFRTKVSRGTGYREYDDGLFRLMCKALGLNRIAEVRDLLFCPMGKEDYVSCLKKSGFLKAE